MTLLDLLPFVAILVIMYLLLVRPAKKRQQEQARMIAALSPGVTVMTASGMVGTVREVGAQIGLEVAPGVIVRFVPGAIARVMPAAVESDAGSGGPVPSLSEFPEQSADAAQGLQSHETAGTGPVGESAAPDSAVADSALAPRPPAGSESRQQPS